MWMPNAHKTSHRARRCLGLADGLGNHDRHVIGREHGEGLDPLKYAIAKLVDEHRPDPASEADYVAPVLPKPFPPPPPSARSR